MIKIPRRGSILNGLGSKFNTSGLNIQRWKMTPGRFSTRFKILRYTGEGLQNLGLCSALRAFEQGGIFIMPHLLWHRTSVFPVSSEGPPHLVAFYDTRGDVEDLFQPGSSRGLLWKKNLANLMQLSICVPYGRCPFRQLVNQSVPVWKLARCINRLWQL
jgi:hypothetical protein